jgi:cobalamin synthase
MTGSALVPRMYGVSSWVLIALLAFQAVTHLVLTALFYAGAHDQGYGYFLDFRWPAWVIRGLDVGAATSLWWVYRRGRDRRTVSIVLTAAACAYIAGRMAWTIVVPALALIVLVGAIMRQQSAGATGDQAPRTTDRS